MPSRLRQGVLLTYQPGSATAPLSRSMAGRPVTNRQHVSGLKPSRMLGFEYVIVKIISVVAVDKLCIEMKSNA